MEEAKDVVESSPTLEAAIASSPEAIEEVKQRVQDTQEPTAEQGESQEQVEQEEAKIPYSRLKEVVDEKNWLKQQLEIQLQQRQAQQQFQQPTQAPQELGNTPEEREFWRMQRQIAAEEADKKINQLTPIINAARQELAKIGVQLFRKDHPDVLQNSAEEMEIAERIGMGYTAEDAYRVIMWDKKVGKITENVKQQVKQQIQAKKKANVETSSGVPVQNQNVPKKTFKETFEELYDKAERGEI